MALAPREERRPTEKRLRGGRSAEGGRISRPGKGRKCQKGRRAGTCRPQVRAKGALEGPAAATRGAEWGRGGVTALHVRYVPRERLLPRCWELGPPPSRSPVPGGSRGLWGWG